MKTAPVSLLVNMESEIKKAKKTKRVSGRKGKCGVSSLKVSVAFSKAPNFGLTLLPLMWMGVFPLTSMGTGRPMLSAFENPHPELRDVTFPISCQ